MLTSIGTVFPGRRELKRGIPRKYYRHHRKDPWRDTYDRRRQHRGVRNGPWLVMFSGVSREARSGGRGQRRASSLPKEEASAEGEEDDDITDQYDCQPITIVPGLHDDNPQSLVLCCYQTSTRARSASGMHESACETPK